MHARRRDRFLMSGIFNVSRHLCCSSPINTGLFQIKKHAVSSYCSKCFEQLSCTVSFCMNEACWLAMKTKGSGLGLAKRLFVNDVMNSNYPRNCNSSSAHDQCNAQSLGWLAHVVGLLVAVELTRVRMRMCVDQNLRAPASAVSVTCMGQNAHCNWKFIDSCFSSPEKP